MAQGNPYRQPNMMQLLCLSNGHGEDVIAVRILEQLRQQLPSSKVFALPLVGTGRAYARAGIPLAGPVRQMPSGGFIYMDGGRQAWRDLRGGLALLTWQQWQVVRHWSGRILAVGDVVPLLFAWASGCEYAFVGTAKSEYYLRDSQGRWLEQTPWLDRYWGTAYFPWERWLLRHPRCRGIYPRDRLTTEVLQQWQIPAEDLGNPMMDAIVPELPWQADASLKILLLPGSRLPEAARNWQLLLAAVESVLAALPHRLLTFLAAIAPGIPLETLTASMPPAWQPVAGLPGPIADPQARSFQRGRARLQLLHQAYHSCLLAADAAIAMAGTATEQFVGLGKPAIVFPGSGPQFTAAFAEAQSRHLGASVVCVDAPAAVAPALQSLLSDPARLARIAANGRQRLGPPGAAERIAGQLRTRLLCP